MNTIKSIEDIVCSVQGLEIGPTEGINQISAVLELYADHEAVMSPPATAPMTPRAWGVLCLLALIFGILIGWSGRVSVTKDRYLTSLAERHEATARYYNERTDQLINTNPNPSKGAQPHGKN